MAVTVPDTLTSTNVEIPVNLRSVAFREVAVATPTVNVPDGVVSNLGRKS